MRSQVCRKPPSVFEVPEAAVHLSFGVLEVESNNLTPDSGELIVKLQPASREPVLAVVTTQGVKHPMISLLGIWFSFLISPQRRKKRPVFCSRDVIAPATKIEQKWPFANWFVCYDGEKKPEDKTPHRNPCLQRCCCARCGSIRINGGGCITSALTRSTRAASNNMSY